MENPTSKQPAIPGKPAKFWQSQIELAIKERRRHEAWWEANLKAYAPPPDMTPESFAEHINTNRDFVLVERKKADLFYQRPEVSLQPTPLIEQVIPQVDPATGQPAKDPQTGQPLTTSALPALSAHEDILNELLGPDNVDAVLMAHQTLFDVLCTSGIGFTKMGYESVTREVEQEVSPAVVDPLTGAEIQPAQTMKVPVPVYEKLFWHHFSPKQAIIPHDFRSVEWDRAPFLGYEFTLPLTPTNRQRYKLPKSFKGSAPKDEQKFDHGAPGSEQTRGVFTGYELFYKSALYREDIVHPEHLTHLVMVDGIDEPVLHENYHCQTLDDRGQLTPDSLIGFPIHPLTTRVLTDSAYPPSDCTVIRPLVNELNTFRTQMVQYRDAQTLRWSYNTDTLPPDALQKIVRSPIGGMIGLPAEAFVGEGAIKELPHGSMPRESFTSNDYIDNDIARTTAIDAAGAGVQSANGDQTATEAQIQQGNANARLDFERGRVLQWYVRGCTKFSTLIQRYLPAYQAVQIVGPQRAQVWEAWRKTVPSALAFTAMPDSALRVDQAVDRRQAQELYTYLANDPFVAKGRQKLLERVLRKFHIDPTGIVAPPDPPSPQPTPASLSFKGEDLVGPQAPIVLELLLQSGWKISPQAVQQSQQLLLQAQEMAAAEQAEQEAQKQAGSTEHGGKVAPMESLDKHQADSGMGMQGVGGIAQAGQAGGVQ